MNRNRAHPPPPHPASSPCSCGSFTTERILTCPGRRSAYIQSFASTENVDLFFFFYIIFWYILLQQNASRFCKENGRWFALNESNEKHVLYGWTNYTSCRLTNIYPTLDERQVEAHGVSNVSRVDFIFTGGKTAWVYIHWKLRPPVAKNRFDRYSSLWWNAFSSSPEFNPARKQERKHALG